jgi:Fe-S cluster biosynthesis and repair protein YggX
MTTPDERIAQFEKMAHDDPDNDMAHFSLGTAYAQSDRNTEAAKSFARCIELNDGMSKAYQLAGAALIACGETDEAARTLERGYVVAAGKGDMMPHNEMGELLRSIGREPPELSPETRASAEQLAASGAFTCSRTGRAGTQLPEPPMRGAIGKWIHENISAETWSDWIGQGTKVINELRLDFSREEDQQVFDEHMFEFLGIDAALREQLTSKSSSVS